MSDDLVGRAPFSVFEYMSGPYGMWIDAYRVGDMTVNRSPDRAKRGHMNRVKAWETGGSIEATPQGPFAENAVRYYLGPLPDRGTICSRYSSCAGPDIN